MLRVHLSRVFTLMALAALSACGFFPHEAREPWRREAEAQCLQAGALASTVTVEQLPAIEGPGVCGMVWPLKVTALSGESVEVPQKTVLACPMVVGFNAWLEGPVQEAARAWFGAPVVRVETLGTYGCRRQNNARSGRWSEHAFGNAVDVSGFVLADGRRTRLRSGWRGTPEEVGFWQTILARACEQFTTVLGPGSDGMHEDHMHVDLARHDARGTRRYCRPAVREPSPPVRGPVPGLFTSGLGHAASRLPALGTRPAPPMRPPVRALTIDEWLLGTEPQDP